MFGQLGHYTVFLMQFFLKPTYNWIVLQPGLRVVSHSKKYFKKQLNILLQITRRMPREISINTQSKISLNHNFLSPHIDR